MNQLPTFGSGLLFILLAISLVFLAGREFFCWYWKINQLVGLMTEIRDSLAKTGALAPIANAVAPTQTKCSNCSKVYAGNLSGQFCEDCGTKL